MVCVLVINRCRTNRLALREVKQMYFKCDFWGEGLGGGLATGSGSGLPQGCPGSTAASPEGLTQGTYFQGGSSVSATVGWDPAPPTWACLQAAEHPDDVVAASPVPGMREQSGRGGGAVLVAQLRSGSLPSRAHAHAAQVSPFRVGMDARWRVQG